MLMEEDEKSFIAEDIKEEDDSIYISPSTLILQSNSSLVMNAFLLLNGFMICLI